MKRFVVAILILTLIITTAIAEDYSSMTIEELPEVRDEKIKELSVINSLIATMHSNQIDSAEDIDSVSIGDLFPDKTFAEYIRDTLGKTSIHDAVTQDDLDTITKVRISYNGDVSDLTGISHLRNLTSLSVTPYKSSTITDELLKLPYLRGIDLSYYSGTTLPDWFTQMSQLEWLEFAGSSLVTFPDDIGNLGNLTYIMLNNSTDFTDLPQGCACRHIPLQQRGRLLVVRFHPCHPSLGGHHHLPCASAPHRGISHACCPSALLRTG